VVLAERQRTCHQNNIKSEGTALAADSVDLPKTERHVTNSEQRSRISVRLTCPYCAGFNGHSPQIACVEAGFRMFGFRNKIPLDFFYLKANKSLPVFGIMPFTV
jgi:hypothetical protein